MVGEFQKLLGDKIVPPDEVMNSGNAARDAFIACDGVVACLVEAVGGLGWDAFVVGNIAGLRYDRVINLKLYDVRTGGEVRRASDKASGAEKQLITNMRTAAVTLLAPELLVGRVVDRLREWGGEAAEEMSGSPERIVFNLPKALRSA